MFYDFVFKNTTDADHEHKHVLLRLAIAVTTVSGTFNRAWDAPLLYFLTMISKCIASSVLCYPRFPWYSVISSLLIPLGSVSPRIIQYCLLFRTNSSIANIIYKVVSIHIYIQYIIILYRSGNGNRSDTYHK